MAEGESGWEELINENLTGEKKCFLGAVGDGTSGYMLGHVSTTDENSDKWTYLYTGETYTVDVLKDDLVSTEQIEVCEPTALKEALDNDKPPQGIYLGGKKYRVVQVQSLPSKAYADVTVKSIRIALDKIAGCISTDGSYYVIGLIDTKEVEQKNLAFELASEFVACLSKANA